MTCVFVWLLKLPIHAYRLSLSYLIGGRCRFQPTCSVYALQALDRHGPVTGLWLAAKRLARCHPFARGGHWQYDPVPDPKEINQQLPCDTAQSLGTCGNEQRKARTAKNNIESDHRQPKSEPPKP